MGEKGMNLKRDLTKEDLIRFFKDYQLDALKAICESDEGKNSRDVWMVIGETQISRASIINFLEASTETGLLVIFNPSTPTSASIKGVSYSCALTGAPVNSTSRRRFRI